MTGVPSPSQKSALPCFCRHYDVPQGMEDIRTTHKGPWAYYDQEYSDEGIVGPYDTYEEAATAARAAYSGSLEGVVIIPIERMPE